MNPYAPAALLQEAHDSTDGSPEQMLTWLAGRVAELERVGRLLLAEYEREEEEHGFPFNLALRDAHRWLRAVLEHESKGQHLE